jgi:hypothetical protein
MREKNFIFAAYLSLFWAINRQKVRKARGFLGWIWHEIEDGGGFFSLSEP